MVPQTTTDASETPSLLGDISHKRINAFGKRLSVIRLDGEEFLIGVQIASLLKRETFNMYRSMKIKNISIQRANPEQVDFLCKCNAVRTGTHSVTLIPHESGLYFIADAISRQKKSENFPFAVQIEKSKNTSKTFAAHQPKLHRRKAHPWDVHRSIKKEDLNSINSPYADFDTPFTDIKAKQLAISKLNELSNSDNKTTKKTPQKIKPNLSYDPFNSLLFAAGSLEDFDLADSPSPSPFPSLSLNSSPSSSLHSSPTSSPSYSPALSPQHSPSHPSNDHDLFHLLPRFNLGIFAKSENNCINNNSLSSLSQYPVSSF
jgi:hypothetical protein